jgi:hypothetical protein
MSNSLTPLPKRHEAAAPDAGAVALLSKRVRPGGPQVDSRWAVPRACVRPRTLMLALLLAELLSACGGGSGGGSQQSAQPTSSGSSPAPTQALIGHYVGAVKIADVTYFGDAVFTRDGAVRLYVGSPDNEDEALQILQITRPERSEQFVGTIQLRDGQWSGSGVVIGQQCAVSTANPFCTQPSSANISANVQRGFSSGSPAIQGNIQVATAGAIETWLLDLQLWPDINPATSVISGQFKEMLAEFASAGDVIVNFDSSGRFFFQSAASGCVGNGTSVARSDGSANTYDVTLMMENCKGAYAYLNGQYDGLALYTTSSYWDYDSLPRMWLSKPTGETPPAALTTLGEPL